MAFYLEFYDRHRNLAKLCSRWDWSLCDTHSEMSFSRTEFYHCVFELNSHHIPIVHAYVVFRQGATTHHSLRNWSLIAGPHKEWLIYLSDWWFAKENPRRHQYLSEVSGRQSNLGKVRVSQHELEELSITALSSIAPPKSVKGSLTSMTINDIRGIYTQSA